VSPLATPIKLIILILTPYKQIALKAMSDKSQKTLTEDDISSQWPLHWLVWNDDHMALNRLLDLKVYDKESRDPRGRTPLHLAVTLKRKKCAEVLLYHGADALALNRHQWSGGCV
jgi:ankyrin repeat protein